MQHQDQFQRFQSFSLDDFEKELLISSFHSLEDANNKLRFNNFSYAIRELSRHLLHRLAPDEEVIKCQWFKNETNEANKISRGERIKYAIQGGIPDNYADEFLDIATKKTNLVETIKNLNKYTHIEEHTFNISDDKLEELLNEVTDNFEAFSSEIAFCRHNVMEVLETKLYDIILEYSTFEYLDALAELSTHFSVDETHVNDVRITSINSEYVEITIEGTLEIVQQWGSNADVRNDDGLTGESSFPFKSTLNLPITEDFPHEEIELINFEIDTDEWHQYDYPNS